MQIPFLNGLLSAYSSGSSGRAAYSYVDTLHGVAGGGHVFPGATAPWGSVKLGIDTDDLTGAFIGGGNNAGWSDPRYANVTAISYLHVSGTGGGPKYGVLAQTPTTIDVNFDALNRYTSRFGNETSSPGFYAFDLEAWGVHVELTATTMVGVARYDFAELVSRGGTAAQVLIDLSHVLGTAQTYREGSVHINDARDQITGHATYRGGWNLGDDFTVYFCSQFSRAADGIGQTQGLAAPNYGTFRNSGTHAGWPTINSTSDPIGAFLVFDIAKDPIVISKLGISFLTSDAACAAVERETGRAGFDLDMVKSETANQWEGLLSTIDVEGGLPADSALTSEDMKSIFYSSLYRTHVMPVDRQGENPRRGGNDTSRPVYDDWFTIWDLHRCSTPLMTLLQPERMTAMLRSILDSADYNGGWLFDGQSGFSPGLTQGGSNADIIMADALVKGLDLDWEAVWKAVTHNAEVEPPGELALKVGRSRLDDYKRLGFVPQAPRYWWDGRSLSKTMEYAGNDRAIATIAKYLNKTADAETYMSRSRNWQNLWDADHLFMSEKGWLVPKHPNGTTFPWNLSTSTGNWDKPTYEGTGLEYQFAAPHDIRGLICRFAGRSDARERPWDVELRGRETFIRRLDAMFNTSYDPGNEPSFLSPFLYIYAGRHDLTVSRVYGILRDHYRTGPTGIPGNDDSGAMGAYFVWLSLGLYPVTGTEVYLLAAPSWNRASIKLGGSVGSTLTIRASNLANNRRHVIGVILNGKPLDRAWITHAEIAHGADLLFIMGEQPTEFGRDNPPPSDTVNCSRA
ncbi:hypothetical protein PYCC9005_001702 [Savitreella phatthalungensis]